MVMSGDLVEADHRYVALSPHRAFNARYGRYYCIAPPALMLPRQTDKCRRRDAMVAPYRCVSNGAVIDVSNKPAASKMSCKRWRFA